MSVVNNDSSTSKITSQKAKPKRRIRPKTELEQIEDAIISLGDIPAFPKLLFDHNEALGVCISSSDVEYKNEMIKWSMPHIKELRIAGECDFNPLYSKFPNFKEVIEFFHGQAKLSNMAERWYKSRPILLLGDPGIGKTYFSKCLSELLGMDFKVISCGTVTASWVISGLSGSWKGSKPGEIARFLKDSRTSNPIILLDEIDKLKSMKDGDPYGALYGLLEKETASVFVDEFLGFPMDTSDVNWIATANHIEGIPEAIVSRFKVVHVNNPSKEDMLSIINQMFTRLVVDNDLQNAIHSLEEPAARMIASDSATPRKAVESLLEAFGRAALIGTGGKAVIKAEHCITKKDTKRKVGF